MADSAIPLKVTAPEYTTQAFTKTVNSSQTSFESQFTIDVSKAGYTPIGIVSTSDSNYYDEITYFYNNISLSGTTVTVGKGCHLRGNDRTQSSSTLVITVKYIKN